MTLITAYYPKRTVSNSVELPEEPASNAQQKPLHSKINDVQKKNIINLTEDSPSENSSPLLNVTNITPKRKPRQRMGEKNVVNLTSDSSSENTPPLLDKFHSAPIKRKPGRQVTKKDEIKTQIVNLAEAFSAEKPNPFKDIRMVKIGSGTYHDVYEIAGQKTITLNEKEIPASDLIIKKLNPKYKDDNRRTLIKISIEAYKLLLKENVPVPNCYVIPDENNELWAQERMKSDIDVTRWEKSVKKYDELDKVSQGVLKFARRLLEKMAQENRDFPDDFFPRNIMLNKDDKPCVVDFSLPVKVKKATDSFLMKYLNAWSRNNPNVFEYLIKKFPSPIKDEVLTAKGIKKTS